MEEDYLTSAAESLLPGSARVLHDEGKLMRKALLSPLLAVIACLLMAATPALAQTVVSSPVSGNGTDGNEQCAPGTYATNRSKSNIAVDPTKPSHLLGLSKFFFSSPSSGGTDWSSVYRCKLRLSSGSGAFSVMRSNK